MKYVGTIAFSLVFALSATFALALGADGYGSVEAGAGTNSTIGVGAGASANANGSMEASGDDTSSGAGAEAKTNSGINAEVNVGPISIGRADVDSDTAVQAAVTSASSVSTGAELSAYASGVVKADENVSDVELTDTAVSLGYKQRARLFGFIPIFVRATATVKANGETTVRYPWYAFLATKDSASVTASVKIATSATVAANAEASAKLSAAMQARLLEQIHAVMQSNLKASLMAEANAKAKAGATVQ